MCRSARKQAPAPPPWKSRPCPARWKNSRRPKRQRKREPSDKVIRGAATVRKRWDFAPSRSRLSAKDLTMNEFNAGFPFDPMIQRYRDYARQRQMTLGDLLLENRIVFLGSS